MKKLMFVLLLFASTVSYSQSKWKFIGLLNTAKDTSMYYASTDEPIKDGLYSCIWVKTTINRFVFGNKIYTKANNCSLFKVDCSKRRVMLLQYSIKTSGDYPLLDDTVPDNELYWINVVPTGTSAGEFILSSAGCGVKK